MKIWDIVIGNKKHLMTFAFALGFVVDSFTLTRVDLGFTIVTLLAYLVVATGGVVLASISRGGGIIPYATQFAFGGLLSGYFIFFTRSASFASSWFFILLLVIAIFGNEFLQEEKRRFELRVAMLFAAFFFFAIIYVPVVMKSMGAGVFLLSGFLSLLFVSAVLVVVGRIAPEVMRATGRTVKMTIGGLFVGVNVLYFANIIPPIPLILKDAGVYHHVARMGDAYTGRGEVVPWYNLARYYRSVVHRVPGEPVYFYGAVFAPTALNTTILHEWQYFDETRNAWATADRLKFFILGGRDGGYRGYSMKQSVAQGVWRVNVITDRGQMLGRTTFEVVDVSEAPVLTEKSLE